MFHQDPKPKFRSEEVESFFARVIGRFFAKCEWEKTHGSPHALLNECVDFWWAWNALSDLTAAMKDCTHANIAISNDGERIAQYIEDATGIDPTRALDYFSFFRDPIANTQGFRHGQNLLFQHFHV